MSVIFSSVILLVLEFKLSDESFVLSRQSNQGSLFIQLSLFYILLEKEHPGFDRLQIKKRPESQKNFSYLKSRFLIGV